MIVHTTIPLVIAIANSNGFHVEMFAVCRLVFRMLAEKGIEIFRIDFRLLLQVPIPVLPITV